ncbi:hypothetical protein [Natrialba asiatica]|uniref:hypothetical protein n=1 Tax=Natrialba asiatica TaxID=64602 RepID=UPI000AB8065E|nr:hypothetical protein [Natrialba asiatica]
MLKANDRVDTRNRDRDGTDISVDREDYDLVNSQLLNGSETVYDSDGNQFERGEDYEMR